MTYRRYQGARLTPVWVLISLNFVLYLFTIVLPENVSQQFVYFMVLRPDAFLSQPWAILTSLFIHQEFWHLFANMLTLYFFGTYFYQLAGEDKFLFVYFGGGIVGSISYMLLEPDIPVIGASGAIFALGGALAMLRPSLRVLVLPIPAPLPLWGAVIGGFLIMSFFPNIAWQAHLGGLVFGLIAGYVFKKRQHSFS